MILNRLESAAEAVLFAAGGAVSPAALQKALRQDAAVTKAVVERLSAAYAENGRGIKIITVDGCFQMCSNPDYFGSIMELAEVPQRKALSSTLLETLAVIAYKQPVTKAAIEEIRGVSADHAVNRLVEYGLVCERGRLDAPGRPILFGTTEDFLRHFGLESLDGLSLRDFSGEAFEGGL